MSRAAIPLQLAGDAGDVDTAVTRNGDDSSTFEAVGIDTRSGGGELRSRSDLGPLF